MPAMSEQNPANDNERRAELAKKILEVCDQLGTIPKEGQNVVQKYRFISYEQLNERLAKLLPKIGLALIPSFDEIEEREITIKNGNISTRSVVKGSMLIVDCITGFCIKQKLIGADIDTAGKSAGKAETEAVKRFEMKLFHVSSEDDPDSTGVDMNGGWGAPPVQQQYRQPNPPQYQRRYLR